METTICSGPFGISPNEFFASSFLAALVATAARTGFLRTGELTAGGFNADGLFAPKPVLNGAASPKLTTNRYATPATRVLRKNAIPAPPAECGTGVKPINVVTLVSLH